MGVGCALAAQLLAREQTWRDKRATYLGATRDLARFHTLSSGAGYVRPSKQVEDLLLLLHTAVTSTL